MPTIDTFPARDHTEAFGRGITRVIRVRDADLRVGTFKIEQAAALGTSAILSPAQADAVAASLALSASALRHGGKVPAFSAESAGLPVTLGADPSGPIWSDLDDTARTALFAASGAIRRSRQEHERIKASYAVDPPAELVDLAGGGGGGGGEKLGLAPAIVVGGVVAAVVLVGGVGWAIGHYQEASAGTAVKWQASEAIAVQRAKLAADLALERYRLQAKTGTEIAPSPLEVGVSEDVKSLAMWETKERWSSVALGAALGVVGAVGAGYALRRRGWI